MSFGDVVFGFFLVCFAGGFVAVTVFAFLLLRRPLTFYWHARIWSGAICAIFSASFFSSRVVGWIFDSVLKFYRGVPSFGHPGDLPTWLDGNYLILPMVNFVLWTALLGLVFSEICFRFSRHLYTGVNAYLRRRETRLLNGGTDQ